MRTKLNYLPGYDLAFVRLFAVVLTASAFFMSSCQDELEDDLDKNMVKEMSISEKDELRVEFAKGLAFALEENTSLRELLKEEALKQFDKDYDVLYQMIKNRNLNSNSTIQNVLSKYIGEKELSVIESTLPLLTIYVPELPDFSAELWDVNGESPEVAVHISNNNKVVSFNGNGVERVIPNELVPAFPVVVVKTNERVTLSSDLSNINARTNSLGFYASKDLSFSFVDESFNGTKEEKKSDDQARSIFTFATDDRLETAYNLDINWQRDYIYYGLTPTNDRGRLKNNYSETITSFGFMDNVDPKVAYNRIADQSGDPRYWPPSLGGGASTKTARWTEGNFEFKVTVLVNSNNGIGTQVVKVFPVRGNDLFTITYERHSIAFYRFKSIKTRKYFPYIEILPWDLQNYSMGWKFIIEEVDPGQTIKSTKTIASKFAANLKLTAGYWEKLGLELGVSAERTKTQSHEITTNLGSDELGEATLTFDQPVITSKSSLFYRTREITTGWMTMSVEPKRIY